LVHVCYPKEARCVSVRFDIIMQGNAFHFPKHVTSYTVPVLGTSDSRDYCCCSKSNVLCCQGIKMVRKGYFSDIFSVARCTLKQ